ncbi:hypothetical protein [Rhizobium sp. BK376]|nr:hypothetical protein [Rhizobium sp. BK376]
MKLDIDRRGEGGCIPALALGGFDDLGLIVKKERASPEQCRVID